MGSTTCESWVLYSMFHLLAIRSLTDESTEVGYYHSFRLSWVVLIGLELSSKAWQLVIGLSSHFRHAAIREKASLGRSNRVHELHPPVMQCFLRCYIGHRGSIGRCPYWRIQVLPECVNQTFGPLLVVLSVTQRRNENKALRLVQTHKPVFRM